MQKKLDLEKLFNEAKVQIGEKFYSTEYGEVKFESVSQFLGTTLLNFRTRHGNTVAFTCDGYYYMFGGTEHVIKIFPSIYERDWFKWVEKRKNGNKCEENLFQTENKIVYLVIKPENIMKELTIREWNDFIDRYTNDKNSVVEPYDENMDGYIFITTSLENILNNHSFNDLRFLVPEKTEYHITEFKLNK
jgi:hypothetical protein